MEYIKNMQALRERMERRRRRNHFAFLLGTMLLSLVGIYIIEYLLGVIK